MNSFSAFLRGLKPAYLATHMYELKEIEELKAKGYPNVFIDHEYGGSTIFFKSGKLKNRYIAEMVGVEMNSREEILITGKYLGYPPIASKFFADARHDETLRPKRASFNYYGIKFAGNIEDKTEICEWLWANVTAPVAAVEVKYRKEIKQVKPVHKAVVSR